MVDTDYTRGFRAGNNWATELKVIEMFEQVVKLIDEMLTDPPMRGDVALSDLRRLLVGAEKKETE